MKIVFSIVCRFLPILVCGFLPLLAEASNGVEKKECRLIDAREMEARYADSYIRLTNMFIFDIRPYSGTVKVKNIPLSMGIAYETIENDALYDIDAWKDKNIYLVGDDTESTESFCRAMLKKRYPIADIFVLKGGMKTWNGPVSGPFNEIGCDTISSQELMKMKGSGRLVEFVDLRSYKDFLRGHIPGAVGEGQFNREKENLCLTGIFSRMIRSNGVVAFVGYNENRAVQRCKTLKWAVAYDNMYVLDGNMDAWKGNLEKGGVEKTSY